MALLKHAATQEGKGHEYGTREVLTKVHILMRQKKLFCTLVKQKLEAESLTPAFCHLRRSFASLNLKFSYIYPLFMHFYRIRHP